MSDVGEWTVHTLKQLIEVELRERDRRWQVEREALALALQKAEVSNEARLALLNEFRQQTVDEQARFVQRIEFEALRERTNDTSRQLGAVQTKLSSLLWIVATLLGLMLGAFVAHLFAGGAI